MATQGTSVIPQSDTPNSGTTKQGTSLAFSFPPYGWKVRQLGKEERRTSLKKRNKKKRTSLEASLH